VEITREAEVANGTFYTYFDTKEEVFLEVAQQFVDQVASAAKDPGDPAVENLTTTLEGWFDAYAEHGRLLRVLNEGAGHSPVVRRAARDMRRATVGFAAERIRLLQQAGLGDPTADPMLFADLLGGLMQAAAYNHVFLDPSADRARVIAALKLIWERAVLRPAAPVPARRRKPAS
jgi:AcrR family transcriptional regulator